MSYEYEPKNHNDGMPTEEELKNIRAYQKWFEENQQKEPYPLYPNYGKITKYEEVPLSNPEQRQFKQPGHENLMVPKPIIDNPNYKGSGKLKEKVALITGGDSGIGASAAIAFAKKVPMLLLHT